MTQRLVNVSNRLPFPGSACSPGGLATGVLAAMRGRGGLWFGWNGETHTAESDRVEVTVEEGIAFARISLPEALRDDYYNGFANGTLWPLLHNFLDGFRYRGAQYNAYNTVNELFARRLRPLLKRDDLIWVHDYHLFPLGRCLRALDVGVPIGFFLHVPFPHFEVLRALPSFAELIESLLAYDLVGFQTETDRQAFLGAVAALWGRAAMRSDGSIVVDGRTIRTEVFPIGVDTDAIARSAVSGARSELVARMNEGLLGRRLIMGVDRLDYSKGILERFEAYRQFLQEYPRNLGNVTYLQIAPLSRLDVQAYARMRDLLEQSAGRTNGHYATADWTPVRYVNRNFPHDVLLGFMRSAHVCLVTSLRDGMNLVAKEYIAAQDPSDPGVLVLSDRAGAACELRDALIVNPYDASAVAGAIQAAVSMSLAERRARHERLLASLRRHDIHVWQSRFLGLLARCGVPNIDTACIHSTHD